MKKSVLITGAGSGVGRAVAIALVKQNWRVALLGRSRDTLDETARLTGATAEEVIVHPCDIGRVEQVQAMASAVFQKFNSIDALINAAGTNAPNRSLEVLTLEDYHAMIDTNLHGAYYCVQAVLPRMRERGVGTIVNIVSDAGKQASPKSGPAYSMSKFGLTGLTQSINAEERGHGVRACAIFPGDIDTPLLLKRPQPPTAEQRAKMMQPEDIAECVLLAINLPARTIVEEILVRPR
ncbi:MAG TPA: SDR family oxidoreductase [Candidatus Acidoferrum sp.]|nr:SDR family oxidoreductase [Candidatus Acidoferrum sp.]